MSKAYHTAGSPGRISSDPFNAVVGQIGFVVHRDKPTNWSITNVANQQYDILALALSGRAMYECDDERFATSGGTMLFFPRGMRHSATTDPLSPWSFYSAGFTLNESDRLPATFEALPHHVQIANVTQIADYFRQLHRYWTAGDRGFSLACRGLVMLLMEQYVTAAQRAEQHVPHAPSLEAIVKQMHRHVGRMYTVRELARQTELSESRFRSLFHRMTGCSVTRYQNRLRIQAAADMLATGGYSVSAVAEELGFRDVYYFSRLFKRITGVTPSACRQR